MSAVPTDQNPPPGKTPRRARHQPKNQKKADEFATPGRDTLQLGNGLYPTGDPNATEFVPIDLNIAGFGENIWMIITELTSSPEFIKHISRRGTTLANRNVVTRDYSNSLFSAAIIRCMQNYCQSMLSVHGVIGDVSSIINCGQDLPNVLGKYATLFGLVIDDHNKIKYAFPAEDHMDTVRRLANVAEAASNGADLAALSTAYYSPTHADDRSIDTAYMVGLKRILMRHPNAAGLIEFKTRPFQNANIPLADALHAAAAFDQDDTDAIAFYTGNRPAQLVGYGNGHWTLISAATGIPRAQLGQAPPGFAPLGEFKNIIGRLAAAYSLYEPLTKDAFLILGNENTKGNSGSMMQACRREILDEVVVVHQPCPLTPSEVAFAAILPAPFRTVADLPRARHNAATANVGLVRREFVARAFRQ